MPAEPAVRDTLARLGPEQRAGQVMSVAFHGRRVSAAVEEMIRRRAVGGVVLFGENAADRGELTNVTAELQGIAREAGVPPLFIATDQEGGAIVRFARGMTLLPGAMALAATPDPAEAVRRAARVTAEELLACGVNWVLAPVADVNDQPLNTIIANRSFGSDPARVSALVEATVRAFAAAGMLCCAKHFPGHGAATADSHEVIPEIGGDRERLERVELAPFRAAIAAGVPSIMTGHLAVPALEPDGRIPASLSRRVTTEVLRGELGFEGIVVADDLEMGALSAIGQAAASVTALRAGADYVQFRFDESAQVDGHARIAAATREGTLPRERLDTAVTRLLEAKRRHGILDGSTRRAPDLDANARVALDLARQSVTLVRNEGGLLPLRGRVFAVATRAPDLALFDGQSDLASELARARPDTVARSFVMAPDSFIEAALAEALAADVVVAGVADLATSGDQRRLVARLAAARPTVLVSLRGPFDALFAPGVAAWLCGYTGRDPTLRALIEVLTGERRPVGSLPSELPGLYPIGAGMRDFR